MAGAAATVTDGAREIGAVDSAVLKQAVHSAAAAPDADVATALAFGRQLGDRKVGATPRPRHLAQRDSFDGP